MEYIVSARKYRPTSFDTVVGQTALTTTLKNAVKSGKLAHAYLFCGPRGVGKTTCARIFAKAINCENPTAEGEACGVCESCKAFEEQRSYNIFELDAASNNTVEDIKTLMEQTRIPPQVGRYKVFIIDEVHMLSTSAFNAFLKTLEEPPAHVIFILATTEKHKLLPTIISRCQIYDFERMTVQNTIDHLKAVADKEGYTYEEEALAVIAEKADGGMRDALSIFDQTASFCQGNITYEKVIEDLNVLDSDNYFRIVDLSLQNKTADVMLLLNDVIARGFDGGNLCVGLASHIRNVMMAKDPSTVQLLEVSAQQKARYAEQAKKCPTAFLYTALRILNDCDLNYKQSSNKRLLVELSLIQIAQITQPDDDTPAAGRSPKRLKTLFKNIVKQVQSKKEAQQVAETERVKQPIHETQVIGAVNETAKTHSEATIKAKPLQKGAAIQLSSLGFTFAQLDEKKRKENNLKKQNEQQEEVIDKPLTAEFTQASLELQWLAMCNRMQLITATKVLARRMKNIHPEIKDYPNIEIVIDNRMLLDEVKAQERRILSTLRKHLNNTEIKIELRQAAPEEIKKIPSKGEIWEELKKNNPPIDMLCKSMDLELT
jgi:DNA polymerase-3 subunit gamma/tau